MIPIYLNFKGKNIVVIGGGQVAEKRIALLLENGARVRLIAPKITQNLQRLVEEKKVNWQPRYYKTGDLNDADFSILAVEKSDVSDQFVQEAQVKKVFINIASDFVRSDFIFPATINRGKLSVAVSTSGAFPMLSSEIISQIDGLLDDDLDKLTDFLAEIHGQVKERFPYGQRKETYKKIILKKDKIMQMIKEGTKPNLNDLLD